MTRDNTKLAEPRARLAQYPDKGTDPACRRRIMKIMESLGYQCKAGQYLMAKKKPDIDKHCFATDRVYGHMRRRWRVSARTGVTCFNKYGQLRVIVEVVGSGKRADFDSHPVYDWLEVPYVLISSEDCDKNGVALEDRIANEMRRKEIA